MDQLWTFSWPQLVIIELRFNYSPSSYIVSLYNHIEMFSSRQMVFSLFSFHTHKTWKGLTCYFVTTLSHNLIQFTCNLLSNHLQRWIGSIHIQCESVQCAFHVDAINLNQFTFNAHYFCCVDRPYMFHT